MPNFLFEKNDKEKASAASRLLASSFFPRSTITACVVALQPDA